MSVKRPKAEVAIHGDDVRYVPKAEVAMPVEQPSTTSQAEVGMCINACDTVHGNPSRTYF